eukprot:TRINITY_DN13275_c0_g1_i1.p1 TRINITY_DN13275_c0_g1~~TRINITY_DN13275_c0_g1_i1.p1  ORF type:complete len:162 (+),score=16.95 TRINITY_DN13275_c0_g1_i1:318-803(+)
MTESGNKAEFEGVGASGKSKSASVGISLSVSAPTCGVCDKAVYAAEQMRLHDVIYHKLCFKCQTCEQPIRIIKTAQSIHGKPYCEDHYRQAQMESGNKAEFSGPGAPGQKPSADVGALTLREIPTEALLDFPEAPTPSNSALFQIPSFFACSDPAIWFTMD